MHTIRTVLLIGAVLLGTASHAQTPFELKVGVVFTYGAYSLGQGSKEAQFAQFLATSNEVYQNSGLLPPNMILYDGASIGQLPGGYDVLWRLPTINPPVRKWRDENAVDVIVLVVPATEDLGSCGAVDGVPSELPNAADVLNNQLSLWGLFSAADTRYVAVVTNLQCAAPADLIAAHEVGHLLYAEHEVCSFDEDTCPSPDEESSIPVDYNHPYKNGTQLTLMHTPYGGTIEKVISGIGNVFPSINVPAGSSTSNNEKLFTEHTFAYTALFRPKPSLFSPPDPPSCTWEFTGCANNQKEFLVSFGSQSSGSSTIVDYIVESSTNGSTWFGDFIGGLSCIPELASVLKQFRVFGITVEGGITPYCHISIPGGTNCDDQQGW
jgi:hypothetical protein